MKDIKALIKIEARPAVLVSLYFLVVNIVFLLLANISINEYFRSYLLRGIDDYRLDMNGRIFLNFLVPLSLFELLGIIMLIYFQFKNDKSVEIGRFIKSLPYTDAQRCLTKVATGVLSYTIPFIITAMGFILLRADAMTKFAEVYSVLPYEEVILTINSAQNLVNLLVLNYMVYTCVYLFAVMLQYIINNNIGSLVIGILSLLAPGFITMSISYIDSFGKLAKYLNYIGHKTLLPLYTILLEWNQLSFDMKEEGLHIRIQYAYIEDIGFKILITTIISVLCIAAIYQAGKRIRIENTDKLMPYAIVRMIFVVGVSLCAAFLMADVCILLWGELVGIGTISATYIAALIGGVIGFVIARKIAYIGIVRRK